MDVDEGRKKLTQLVERYVDDREQVIRLRESIYSEPPRVPVRGIIEEMTSKKLMKHPLSQQDKELLDELFYFFG